MKIRSLLTAAARWTAQQISDRLQAALPTAPTATEPAEQPAKDWASCKLCGVPQFRHPTSDVSTWGHAADPCVEFWEHEPPPSYRREFARLSRRQKPVRIR